MKKKMLAILLIITFSISFSGCSLDEIGFLDTMNSVSKLTDFTFEGSFGVKLNKFEENPDYVAPDYDELLPIEEPSTTIDLLSIGTMIPDIALSVTGAFMMIFGDTNDGKLLYHGSISKTNNKIILALDKKDQEGTLTSLVKLIFDNKTLFVDKEYLDSSETEYTNEETVDGVVYGKFTVNELIQSNFDSMREFLVDGPTGYPMFDEESKTEEYITGYYEGFSVGEQDGYFATETPYVATEIEDQDLGYADGYEAGVISGETDKKTDDKDLLNIDAMQEDLIAQDISSATIINALSDSRQPKVDTLIKNLFANFSLSIVKKDGNSKYVIDMSSNDMLDAFSDAMLFLTDNKTFVKTTLKSFINDMTDAEMQALVLDPADRQIMIDDIDRIVFPQAADIQTKRDEMNELYDLRCQYSLEKTGKNSYETSTNTTFKTLENDQLPFIFDMEIISTMSINNELSGNIGVTESLISNKETTAQIKLEIADENSVETGIMLSKSQDFRNPTIVPAVEQQNGSYLADVSGLASNAKYFYKSYSKDGSGNLVFSLDVKTFNTLLAATTASAQNTANPTGAAASPSTGDTASPWPIVIFIGASVAILAVLFIMKKKAK